MKENIVQLTDTLNSDIQKEKSVKYYLYCVVCLSGLNLY